MVGGSAQKPFSTRDQGGPEGAAEGIDLIYEGITTLICITLSFFCVLFEGIDLIYEGITTALRFASDEEATDDRRN